MAQVLDYSAGCPGAQAIASAGYIGAVRYIGFPSRTKCTTRAELEDFSRNGLGMAVVFQDGKGDWLGGFAAGRVNARRARDHADAIGFPADRPIYMAIDRDVVTEAEFQSVVEYIRGAATELGGPELTGPYGEHDVCERVAAAGVGRWFWQCRAWSGTPIRYFADRHLYQRVGTVRVGGIDCDINDIKQADWGQHNAQEDDMSWSDELTFESPGSRHRPAGTPAYHESHRASEALGDTMFYAADGMRTAQRVEAQMAALVAATAEGDLDPDAVLTRIDTAVREATVQTIETIVLPALRQVVHEVLGEDNVEQADAIVTELAGRLRPAA